MPKRTRPTLVAVVNDVHCGGTTALCPARISFDDGGEYVASKAQVWLWDCWRDYWATVEKRCDALDAELYVIFNGDLVEGDHHRTTQILSGNPNSQAAVLNAAMAIPLALKPNRIVITRGTGAHVGSSACAEERIADGLRRDKRPIISNVESGTASHWHWYANIHGVTLDVTHHGRIGQREHTRASQTAAYAHDIHLAYTKRGERPPDLALRAHNHKWADSFDACKPRVVGVGAWQLGTEHVHKVAPDSLADIGGVIITIERGEYALDKIKYEPARSIAWVAA